MKVVDGMAGKPGGTEYIDGPGSDSGLAAFAPVEELPRCGEAGVIQILHCQRQDLTSAVVGPQRNQGSITNKAVLTMTSGTVRISKSPRPKIT